MRVEFVRVMLAILPMYSWALPTIAADLTTATATEKPPALNFALRRGFHVVKRFSAVSGLSGWVMQDANGQYSVMFTTPDGQTEIDGSLVTTSGENLTQRYIALYVPKPDLADLWTKFEKASVVTTGAQNKPAALIYVIMDPNCIFCHMLWIALRPYEAAGLQVRWIPVGFLHADSLGKAAALLNGGNAVLTQMQDNFDERLESAGAAGINVTPDLKAKLEANLALMHEAQMHGTPGIFYKDSAGQIRRKDGMPKLSELPSITGMAAQPQTDPRLARFNK